MKKRQRWIKRIIEDTRTLTVQLPWERGLRRQAMIARRLDAATSKGRHEAA